MRMREILKRHYGINIYMMSAEPGRKAPYSTDLRYRIVWQKIGLEMTYREIAKNLNVSVGSAHNVFKRFKETGEVEPTKPNREQTRVLDEYEMQVVIGLLFEHPSLYLRELCSKLEEETGITVSTSTMCRIVHSHGFSRKRIQQVALQRSLAIRAKFVAEVQFFNVDQFVWLDETGSDRRDHRRRYGYSLRGVRPVCHHLLHRGQRVSAIAAIATDGLVALELVQGTVNGQIFFDYVRGSLIPSMLPFNGSNPHSILVMDNCSIHHVQIVVNLLKDAGILVLFLPPYSPDLNPIEEMFSYVKYYLKDHDDILHVMPDPIPFIKAAFESATTENINGWIKHSGY